MWAKFSDRAADDPEIDRLSDGAFRLWVTAILYCSGEMTDGVVPADRVHRLTPNYKAAHLAELTATTLHPDGPLFLPIEGGYIIRNFTKYQKPRSYWLERRAAHARAVAEWRKKRGGDNTYP